MGVRVRVAGQQLVHRGLVVAPRARRAGPGPARPGPCRRQRRRRAARSAPARRRPRPACAAPAVRWSGSSARAAATSASRASRRGTSTAGLHCSAARRASAKKGSTTPGLCSVASTPQHAVEEVAGGQLALRQHVPRRHDRHRAVDRVRQLGRLVQQQLERGLVGAHGGEGQVAVVEQVQVRDREVREVRRRAGGLDLRSSPCRSRPSVGADVGAHPERVAARLAAVGAGGEQRRADQADRVGAGAVQPARWSSRPGRGRPPRRRRPIRSPSSALPHAWSRK